MGNITVFSGKTVPFLALWYDIIEGSPHPKPNGYQRFIPGGACGAKGLGKFAQRAEECSLEWRGGSKINYRFVGTLGLKWTHIN